jgi:hypothetical protein
MDPIARFQLWNSVPLQLATRSFDAEVALSFEMCSM